MQIYYGTHFIDENGEQKPGAELHPVEVTDFKNLYESFFKNALKGGKNEAYITIAKEVEITKGDPESNVKYRQADHFHRNNDTQITAQFVPFDGDSSDTDPHSCIPISEVKSALDSLGYKYILYTTHSHSSDRNRWRSLIPCLINDKSKLDPTVTRLFQELKSLCPTLKMSNESKTFSQPWFLPFRDDPDDGMYESYFNDKGREFIAVDAQPRSACESSSSISTSGPTTEPEMIRVIMRGVKSENDEKGLHETFNKYIYMRTVDGMQPGALKPLLHGLSSNWDLSDKRLSDRKKDIDRLVDQAAKKFAKKKLVPKTDEWKLPEPLKVSLSDVSQVNFPLSVLPETLFNAAQEMADFNLCTIHDVVLGMFPVISAAIGRKLLLQAGTPGIEVYPNLGVINVADTGAFKSTLHKLQNFGLTKAIKVKIEKYIAEQPLLKSKISILEKKIKDADANAAKDKDSKDDIKMIFKLLEKSNPDRELLEELLTHRSPHTLVDDTTMERAAILGYESGGEINIFSAEGQSIFKALSDPYSNNKSNTDLLIKGLSGDLFTRGRVGDARAISYVPVINMSFFVQPDIYREQFLYNADVHSSGLAARPIVNMWQSDFKKLKTDETYEVNYDKLTPFHDTVYDIAMVDDRNFKKLFPTIDDTAPHMIKPVSKILYDTRYKELYLSTFNAIRKRQAKGGDLEGKGEAINKCLTLAYSIVSCIKVFEKGADFFKVSPHSFSTSDLSKVDKIVNYLIDKKLVEYKAIESSSRVSGAIALLKVLTRKSVLQHSLKGLSPSIYSRLTNTTKQTIKAQYIKGEAVLMDMRYVKIVNKNLTLNPRWDENGAPF